MNSIVCQSDETESLYFGNFLCNEYDDIEDRYKEILKESNILISSFTCIANDSTMWEKYGDENRGIMLGFESMKGDILTPIQYINEAQDELKILRDNIQSLKKNNIRVHFAEIDKMHRYIKNDRFKDENEWRLIHEYKGKIDSALYNDIDGGQTYAYYHDFPFNGNKLNDLNMTLVSVTIGNKQRRNSPALLLKDIRDVFGDIEITFTPDINT